MQLRPDPHACRVIVAAAAVALPHARALHLFHARPVLRPFLVVGSQHDECEPQQVAAGPYASRGAPRASASLAAAVGADRPFGDAAGQASARASQGCHRPGRDSSVQQGSLGTRWIRSSRRMGTRWICRSSPPARWNFKTTRGIRLHGYTFIFDFLPKS